MRNTPTDTSATLVDAGLLPRTSDQILGHLLSASEPAKGGDLTRVPGAEGAAQGRSIRVMAEFSIARPSL